jgi:hypothetical protein
MKPMKNYNSTIPIYFQNVDLPHQHFLGVQNFEFPPPPPPNDISVSMSLSVLLQVGLKAGGQMLGLYRLTVILQMLYNYINETKKILAEFVN